MSSFIKRFFLLASCLSLCSCNSGVSSRTSQAVDSLFVGAYPRAEVHSEVAVSSYDSVCSCYLYFSFVSKGGTLTSGVYDLSVNLSDSSLHRELSDVKNSLGDLPAFVDLTSSKVADASLKDFLSEGGSLWAVMSVGRQEDSDSIVSAPVRIPDLGYAYCFSTVSSDEEPLSYQRCALLQRVSGGWWEV